MQNIYSVAQANSYIKNMFTQDYLLTSIYIKGEVSNCKYHSSGHIYFTLKDNKGTLACVMFAGMRTGLSFELKEGQQVIVGGSIDVYERDGKYQLYAKEILLDGKGFLYEKYEQLKAELEDMGMFSEEYKKQIPKYIQKLGVVTAVTGAAVQDIINIATRRNPYVQIILYPAIVQGEAAVKSIIRGIKALEKECVDVIIVGRGGGSIEDLWAFNEKQIAQAIFDCEIPIISAVGHETDTTIADYVADLRAPTPSAAAELAVYDLLQLNEKMQDYKRILVRSLSNKIENSKIKADYFKLKFQYLNPNSQIREKRTSVIKMQEQLEELMKKKILTKRHQLALYTEQLKGLSPLDKLNQGFSYVSDEKGKNISNVNQVSVGELVVIQVKNGYLISEIKEKKEIRRDLYE